MTVTRDDLKALAKRYANGRMHTIGTISMRGIIEIAFMAGYHRAIEDVHNEMQKVADESRRKREVG